MPAGAGEGGNATMNGLLARGLAGASARSALAALALCAGAAPSPARDTPPPSAPASAIVTQLRKATTTDIGQPITLPQGDVTVIASTYEIPTGAALPVHKHPSARYAYVLAGNLRVTNHETGETSDYKAGDFIIEMIDTWHSGANTGMEAVRLLVIDQLPEGGVTTVLKE